MFKKLLYFVLGIFATIGAFTLMVMGIYIKDLREEVAGWREYDKRHRTSYTYRKKEEENDSTDNR